MLVIHGIWARGALSLWAEESERAAAWPAANAARRRTVLPSPQDGSRPPEPHPFSAAPSVLSDAFADFGEAMSDLVRKATEDELTLWLPDSAAGPQASPELALSDAASDITRPRVSTPATARAGNSYSAAAEAPSARPAAPTARAAPNASAAATSACRPATAVRRSGRPGLSPWLVPALGFEPVAACAVLRAFAERGRGTERCALGGSLRYLSAIAALAADLAARGRVLPGLDEADGAGYVARWRPVLAGPDALRARELTTAMPPLCRATSADGDPAAAVFTSALDGLTDAAVRASLAGTPEFALIPAADSGRSAPLPDRWAAALTGEDGRVSVEPTESALAAQLAFVLWAWQDAAQEPPGPVRTCFRLIEPGGAEPDAATWQVQFALQSTDDPSLLLPAEDIWSGTAADGWAAAGISYPEDDLLAGLGRASRLFPDLDLELQTAAPASVELDTRAALGFLKETGPLLAGAGFGVLLPDWVRKSRLGLKLTARSRSAAGPGSAAAPKFGLSDLVDFRYELAVGDQALDPAELAELARLKVPLVRLRGQWVELDERHLKAALHFLERGGSGVMSSGDALLTGLGVSTGELPVIEVDADGWLGDLLSGNAESRLTPMPTPASFHGTLRPYQERGLAWLSFLGKLGLGAVLADDMGLGKSPQTLALLQAEREAGTASGPTLLICPMSLVGNWQREAARFTPDLAVHVHHGADRLAGPHFAAAMSTADLVITTYGVATRDRAELAGVPWARVVCDEAQNIKNASTRQAQAARVIPARSRIALTGTPVENRLTELWSIMEFTNPGLLGPAERFRQHYAIPIERNGDPAATEQLRRISGPFILRRLKTDRTVIADLPDKLEMKVWCNLTPEQASLYQATVDDMMEKIEAAEPGIERRGLVLATMAKLKQVCNHPAHLLGDGSRLDGRSGKLARLEEICEEVVEDDDKALCFTQYAEFGRMLQPYLAARLGCDVYFLHGGTSKGHRDELVSRFQDGAEPAVFLLSLKAGGTGLNLTAANHVIHVDRWWNPAVEDQATDRAFRIGQRKDVQVRKFVCVGTVEERIDQMIEEKKALAEAVVGSGESWLTELSVAELRQVIELSPEAVSQ
jgi:SNF2-related domain/SNF2 Helicase protein/Helicase conserved C-terminal domain